ncbi:MAG TPA: hypothetical protein PK511_09160 [Chitinophagales bacterium]|nr:hypothetical protein [Chitinophagales bacterium]HMX03657.1 hypothetical protein [Chitinophagales bacterium]HMZ89056.1 hypothetical protein [Chitinophagales bacterium]HNF69697.1 hypothetical protein [Chitinophagales bacterium]HNI54676.1 hypothetical protein [Chitinophagales bacterium]
MRPATCLIIAISLMQHSFAQIDDVKPVNGHQRIDVNLDLGYRIERTGSNLADFVHTTGFGAGGDYSIGSASLRLVMSPYIHAQSGNDFNEMKAYYKAKGYTLNSFNGGMYYSTGMLLGARYVIPTRRPSGLPSFYAALQYGFQAAHTPACDINYSTINGDIISIKDDQAIALGPTWRLQLGADVLRSGDALYSIQAGVRQERAALPVDRTTLGVPGLDTPGSTEIFQWNGIYAVIGLGVAFNME